MGGKLSDKDMDQLEQWIGTGPKTFTLLYAITRDGCNATTFHQNCDNQGATVTVLYNPQGSVYGGYAPVSWTSSGAWTNNAAAFLYQLRFNGNDKATKFAIRNGQQQNTCYNHPSYGPVFGSGNALCTFSSTINSSGTYFSLNGNMNGFGTTFDNQGINADQINNGNMNVTELEVYKVADGKRIPTQQKPWRKTKTWNEKFLDELTEDIVTFKPLEDLKVKDARILMIGPVGAGKSSFYNTINSIFRGRITQRAGSGSAEQSLTTAYTPYKVKVRSGATLNFRLCDTRGLEESQGLDVMECNYLLDGNIPNYYQYTPYKVKVKSGATLNFRLCDTRGLEKSQGLDVMECNYLLDGNIPNYYQFNPAKPINPKSQGFKANPSPDDMITCAVFVLDATTLEVVSTKLIEKMKSFQTLMNQKGVPQIILLTKIDTLCKDVQADVSSTYKSHTVEQHVDKAAQLLGLPRANVLPVRNYENELELDDNVNILALLSLKQILYLAEDFMENMLEKKNDEETEMENLKLEN